ncbi:3-deoxy-D-manno-octulosonic acid transferase [Halarcobacter mediterraneus]|uniref:3-deoxy-D-manno-octulosonic acid transferase n=1 Tax=Halarcobacter mediterraneus TaxID=2023153 RepID=A0A4Q1AQZ0_9BACT|nr:lipid IV(A) 3-deoxy-D-manno-octulosonic acid transferase [Halarcobacter mediterraneus]RXK11862.1 3-deoxy-D-manno-octulosonic acid transferase [Halarcobacter mediterraneus]
MSLFSILYYFISLVVYILAIPYLLFKSRNNKYKKAIPSKFFLKDNKPFKKDAIWFHVCSMGEAKAIKPLVDELDSTNISVITNTGYEEAKKLSSNVRYLPFEIFLPFWIKKQKALVVMEAELWYFLFLFAKRKGAKTYLINARISDKSYSSYKRFSFFYKRIFNNVDKIFAQTKEDKKRLLELGAKDVEVIGNIKLAQLPKVTRSFQKPNEILITAGSTHEKEEELILKAYDRKYGKLVIVPRHPERFEKVAKLIENYIKEKNLTFHKFSNKEDFSSDIILVDKLGELNNIYSISDVVILGGAFANIGGHNPIEPAYFSCKLISGKRIFNQKSLFECVKNFKLIDNDKLRETLENIENIEKSSLVQKGDIKPIIKELDGIR